MKIDKASRQISLWLLTGLVLLIIMIAVGGITRLTHSGLSIVTWQPIKGVLPPLNEVQWQEAFNAYKQIPEYKVVHHYFTLEDFKKIYFWEYLHRILGRLLGLIFFVFFAYFIISKKIKSKQLFNRLAIIFLLGGLQGVAGWYMVSSGLVENTSVDHLRLALHLSLAMIILGIIYWTVLELRFPENKTENKALNQTGKVILLFVVLQIIYGALTAGLKAGYVFPTYPKMGSEWLPGVIIKMFQSNGISTLIDFPVTVQFIHRWFGLIILLIITIQYFKLRKQLNKRLHNIIFSALFLVTLQFLLGVFTIIYKVPIALAVLHQINAFLLLLNIVTLIYFSKNRNSLLA
jgi:cytochrome c oxidase assembly protein subunit 15